MNMLKTTIPLQNVQRIINIMKGLVEKAYHEIKDEEVLLCLECCDVDLEIATSGNEEFEELIKENFELDEYGEIIHVDLYRQLIHELYDYFIELHRNSGFFDYFPEGEYIVDGEIRESDSDMLAPKGKFYAPFEDALNNK
jgi:hypothetical protein